MNKALIGYSGFIGSALQNQMEFLSLYNSKTVGQMEHKEFDMIVSCGNSSLKWFANKNSESDFQNILSFINIITRYIPNVSEEVRADLVD